LQDFRIVSMPLDGDQSTMPAPKSILFVCMGNICRSPAAEIIFRHQAREAGIEDQLHIDSAGTISYHAGNPPDPRMSETLRQRGYTVKGRARQVQAADLERFDLILTMDEDNLAEVRSLDPSGHKHAKIRPFVDYLTEHEAPRIPDPYYGGQKGFETVIELLEDGCRSLIETIQKGS